MVVVITLVFVLFIHIEKGEALCRINVITDTLPASYNVNRLIMDRGQLKQDRVKIVFDAPQNTHMAFIPAVTSVTGYLVRTMVWSARISPNETPVDEGRKVIFIFKNDDI